MRSGVRLAFDVGSVRIGVARSDATGVLAVPLDAIPAGPTSVDLAQALVVEWEALEVIVGLPLGMDGSPGKAAALARDWASELAAKVGVTVRLIDERLSTVQAQRGLHASGKNSRQSRAHIDSASAVVVLQSCLDTEARLSEPGGEIVASVTQARP